jgi:hypothetical protein
MLTAGHARAARLRALSATRLFIRVGSFVRCLSGAPGTAPAVWLAMFGSPPARRHTYHTWACAACCGAVLQRLRWDFFRLFPTSVLGVILFLTGAQLALWAGAIPEDKGERFVIVGTVALAIWNVGVAFILGSVAHGLSNRGLLGI